MSSFRGAPRRPAARPDLRGQGCLRHRRPSHRQRQSGLARDPCARRADRLGSRAPARRWRPHGRQDPDRRDGVQPQRRERALRHADQSARAGPHSRRIVERIGGRGRRRPGRFRARHRLRRLGSSAGELLRDFRHPHHTRPRPCRRRRSILPRASTRSDGSRANRRPCGGSARCCCPPHPTFVPTRLLIADDAFAFAGPEVSAALAEAVDRLKAAFTHHRHIQVYTGDPAAWSGIFRVLQGRRSWRRHSAWIDAHKPNFGPGITGESAGRAPSGSFAESTPAPGTRTRRQPYGRPPRWRRASLPADGAGHRAQARDASGGARRTSVRAPLGFSQSQALPACRRSRCRSLRWEAARLGLS